MHKVRCTHITVGFESRESKNRSYIPFPKPILFSAPSTPMTGTMAKSTFFVCIKEFLGSLILKRLTYKGSLYLTILKLSPSINGTNT